MTIKGNRKGMPAEKVSAKKVVRDFDTEAYAKILEENNRKVIAEIFSAAVELAIAVRHGPGIIRRAQLPQSEIDAVRAAMEPLISVIDREAVMTVGRVVNRMLEVPSLRDYLQKSTASNLGKAGGRKQRSRLPEYDWLESVMRQNDQASGFNGLSAKEHYGELLLHSDIQEEEGDQLVMRSESAERLGCIDKLGLLRDVRIGFSAVTRMRTHIKKNPL